jgi:hypothetical protein
MEKNPSGTMIRQAHLAFQIRGTCPKRRRVADHPSWAKTIILSTNQEIWRPHFVSTKQPLAWSKVARPSHIYDSWCVIRARGSQ